MIRVIPMAPMLATAIDCSGSISVAAMSSRLSRTISAWAATSTCARPIESSQPCSGATMSSMFSRMFGSERDELGDRVDERLGDEQREHDRAPGR